MQDILEQFYYGKLIPIERAGFNHKNKDVLNEFMDIQKQFNITLSDSQKIHFKEILQKNNQLLTTELSDTFLYGYKLGRKMLCSALLE